MGKLSSFTFITLNGFYKGANESIDWHQHGEEEGEFSKEGANSGSILLFGRKTYEMMSSFWPTDMAAQSFPEVAVGMNAAEKIVLSTSLATAEWNNSRIIRKNAMDEIKQLKAQASKDITVLGSGDVLKQLAENDLVDEFQVMIDPVVIAEGATLFNGIINEKSLMLKSSRVFKSGSVLLTYTPA